MFKGVFKFISGNVREYQGKQYFNVELKIGNYLYSGSTNAEVFTKLKEFEEYRGVFNLFRIKNGNGYRLELSGLE